VGIDDLALANCPHGAAPVSIFCWRRLDIRNNAVEGNHLPALPLCWYVTASFLPMLKWTYCPTLGLFD